MGGRNCSGLEEEEAGEAALALRDTENNVSTPSGEAPEMADASKRPCELSGGVEDIAEPRK